MRPFLALLFILAIAGGLRVAHGRSISGVTQAVLSFPRCWHDRDLPPAVKRDQLETVARAVQTATPNGNERALLLTIAYHESALCHDVHAGFCGPNSCDVDRRTGLPRARSIYQTHQLGLPDADWDALVGTHYEATLLATRHALTQVRRAWALCRREKDPVRGTIVAYGTGAGCRAELPDVGERMATYRRLRGRL